MTALLVTIPIFVLAWAVACPEAAIGLLAALRRRLRAYVIHHKGNEAFAIFARGVREKAARKNIDLSLVEDELSKSKARIMEELGTRAANDMLGTPTPEELWY